MQLRLWWWPVKAIDVKAIVASRAFSAEQLGPYCRPFCGDTGLPGQQGKSFCASY